MFGIFRKNDKVAPRQAVAQRAPVQDVHLPEEVSELLRRREDINAPELRINLLDEQACIQATSNFRANGIGGRLGLIVLDDANDSNPYCYVTRGAAAGMVVHLNHDPEPKIEFASLQAFEAFLRELRSQNRELGESEVPSPTHPNQAALSAAILELAAATEDSDSEFLICLYLPLLRGTHRQLLEELAVNQSFFVREALADALGPERLPDSAEVVRTLAADPHPQVRSAALRADQRLRQVSNDA